MVKCLRCRGAGFGDKGRDRQFISSEPTVLSGCEAGAASIQNLGVQGFLIKGAVELSLSFCPARFGLALLEKEGGV